MIRRRYLLSLLFTGILFQTLPGQGNIRFAVHVDPQFAWLRSSDHKEIDPDGAIFHMQAGLQMDYFFADNYAFILGFGINNMGGKLVFGDSIGYGTEKDPVIVVPEQRIKMNLQYLDIPLGLKLKTEEMGYLTGFLQLGFNPMFNINAHITSRDDDAFDKENIQEEGVNLFNLGYHVGAGAEYRLGGNTALVGGIRWTSGFTKVTNGGPSLNTNALAIHLGMLF